MLSPERFINVCGFSSWIFRPPAFSAALSPLNFLLQLRPESRVKESAKSQAALCRLRSYCLPVLPKKTTNSIKFMAKYYREAVSMSTNSLRQRKAKRAQNKKAPHKYAVLGAILGRTALCCFISCHNFLQNAPGFVRLYLFLYNPLHFWLK